MGLRDLKLQTRPIEVPGGGEFTVRGLSFEDITALSVVHAATMMMLYKEYITKAEGGLDPKDLTTLLAILQSSAPELVAHAIALASAEPGEPVTDLIPMARALPMPVQIEAVEQMMVLTFTSAAQLKKAIEAVARGMTGVTATVNVLANTSP
jgi:hypothetical protein